MSDEPKLGEIVWTTYPHLADRKIGEVYLTPRFYIQLWARWTPVQLEAGLLHNVRAQSTQRFDLQFVLDDHRVRKPKAWGKRPDSLPEVDVDGFIASLMPIAADLEEDAKWERARERPTRTILDIEPMPSRPSRAVFFEARRAADVSRITSLEADLARALASIDRLTSQIAETQVEAAAQRALTPTLDPAQRAAERSADAAFGTPTGSATSRRGSTSLLSVIALLHGRLGTLRSARTIERFEVGQSETILARNCTSVPVTIYRLASRGQSAIVEEQYAVEWTVGANDRGMHAIDDFIERLTTGTLGARPAQADTTPPMPPTVPDTHPHAMLERLGATIAEQLQEASDHSLFSAMQRSLTTTTVRPDSDTFPIIGRRRDTLSPRPGRTITVDTPTIEETVDRNGERVMMVRNMRMEVGAAHTFDMAHALSPDLLIPPVAPDQEVTGTVVVNTVPDSVTFTLDPLTPEAVEALQRMGLDMVSPSVPGASNEPPTRSLQNASQRDDGSEAPGLQPVGVVTGRTSARDPTTSMLPAMGVDLSSLVDSTAMALVRDGIMHALRPLVGETVSADTPQRAVDLVRAAFDSAPSLRDPEDTGENDELDYLPGVGDPPPNFDD